jgi:hypothetical protein
MLFKPIALIQPERHRERPFAPELVELLDAVFEDVHGFEPRLQVVAVLLQLHHLVEIGRDIRCKLLVAND